MTTQEKVIKLHLSTYVNANGERAWTCIHQGMPLMAERIGDEGQAAATIIYNRARDGSAYWENGTQVHLYPEIAPIWDGSKGEWS